MSATSTTSGDENDAGVLESQNVSLGTLLTFPLMETFLR